MNEDPLGGFVLPLSMFILMFGMGLALTPGDFRRIVRVPGPVITGTLIQLIVMPVAGFALALAFELPAMLAVGLVIVAACPGGMASNVMVHFGRANTALSITLTATATTATLLTMPLWIRAILSVVGGEASEVEVPLLSTAVELGGLTVLPVALGMALRHTRPSAAAWEARLTRIGLLGVVGTLGFAGMQRPDPPIAEFWLSFPPAMLLIAVSLVLGFGVPRLLRQSIEDAVTLGVEICLKNGLLGLVVVSGTFHALEPNIPVLIYTTFMAPLAMVLVIYNRIRVRGARAAQI